jgi:hypothetical protein
VQPPAPAEKSVSAALTEMRRNAGYDDDEFDDDDDDEDSGSWTESD